MLLQEVYVFVDWERDVFSISQAVFKAPMPEPGFVTIRLKDLKDSLIPTSSLKDGRSMKVPCVFVGGIVTAAIVVLLDAVGTWYYFRRRRANQQAARDVPNAQTTDSKPDYSYFAPEVAEKAPFEIRTHAGLERRVGGELPAPLEQSSSQELKRKEKCRTVAAALSRNEAVYELPPGADYVITDFSAMFVIYATMCINQSSSSKRFPCSSNVVEGWRIWFDEAAGSAVRKEIGTRLPLVSD